MNKSLLIPVFMTLFVLAGCGGGGGSSSVPEVPEVPDEPTVMEPTDQELADEASTAATDAAQAATDAAGEVQTAIDSIEYADTADALAALTAANVAAQAALDAAAAIDPTNADTVAAANAAAHTAGQAAEAARLAVTELEAAEVVAAQAAQDEAERLAEAAAQAEAARITALTEAIADPDRNGKLPEDDELTDRRPGNDVMITLADGGAVTVDGDTLGENDTSIRNTIEFQPTSQSRADLYGYDVSVHQRTKDGKTDTLTVYTDVKENGDEFFNIYTATLTTAGGFTVSAEGAKGDEETTYDTLDFATTALPKQTTAQMTGGKIPPSPGTNRELEEGEKFSGTFYGVPGTYSCAAICSLTKDEDGVLIISSTMQFQPTKTNNDTQDEHVIAGVIRDDDFVTFGYWMQTEQTARGSTRYGVGVFADGNMKFGLADDGTFTDTTPISRLRGTASYDGSATGMYAKKDLAIENGNVVATPAEAGQFSADVSLTAHFGNQQDVTIGGEANQAINGSNKISSADMFHISGTIDNFQNATGDSINDDWSVTLNPAGFATARVFNETTGSGDLTGQWAGEFYGPTGGNDDGEDSIGIPNVVADNYPGSVAGEFTGHFTDGHVIGAFGATSE